MLGPAAGRYIDIQRFLLQNVKGRWKEEYEDEMHWDTIQDILKYSSEWNALVIIDVSFFVLVEKGAAGKRE